MIESLSHYWFLLWSVTCVLGLVYFAWRKRPILRCATTVFAHRNTIWIVVIAAVAMTISLILAAQVV